MKKKITISVFDKVKEKGIKGILCSLYLKLFFFLGKFERCLNFIQEYMKNNEDYYLLTGIMYYFSNNYQKAVADLKKVVRTCEDNFIAKYFLAETFYMRSEIEKSELYYRHILNDPYFVVAAFHGLGCCYYRKNRYDEAINFFNKALEVNPDDDHKISLLNKKGLCLIAQDKLEDAKSCFEKSLDIYDNYAAKVNLALVLSKLSYYNEAKLLYEEIVHKFPYDINAINNLALCIAKEGNYERAISYCNKGLKIDPINADLLTNKGYCLYKLSEFRGALECLYIAEQTIKDDPILQNNKALCLTAIGKYEEAIEIFDNILQKSPSDDIFLNKAGCLIKMKNYKEALTCLESIQDKDKKLDKFKLKGICYERLGYDKKAIDCYNKSLNIA